MLDQETQSFIETTQLFLEGFDREKLQKEIRELEQEMAQPGFWDDHRHAVKVSQQLAELTERQERVQELQDAVNNLQAALDLGHEMPVEPYIQTAKQLRRSLENEKYLNGPFDDQGAVLTIHSGAGGVDAEDWASMLAAMFQNFAERQHWKVKVIQLRQGDEGGVKSMTLQIEGGRVYGFLKEEAGVHRLVRLSPFNSGGTRETSFALVEILPDNLDMEVEVGELPDKDLKWDYFMASGHGGQSVNKTYSAVRVTHLPTKITVECQNERSQIQNREAAMKYLKNKLAAKYLQERKEYIEEVKGNVSSAEWGSQIRSYVMHPYKLVKDHRSNYESKNVQAVLDGEELIDFIWSVKESKKG
jgi:peptide chain release factor 2